MEGFRIQLSWFQGSYTFFVQFQSMQYVQLLVKGGQLYKLQRAKMDYNSRMEKEKSLPQVLESQRKDILDAIIAPKTNLLIFGAPGTGKTILMKSVLKELIEGNKVEGFMINCSELITQFVDGVEMLEQRTEQTRNSFKKREDMNSFLVVLDQIDLLFEFDNDNSRKIISKLENLLSIPSNLTVVGITNRPWLLNPELLKFFEQKSFIPLPNELQRHSILEHLLESVEHSLTKEQINELSNLTAAYTPSELACLVRSGSYKPVRELAEASELKLQEGKYRVCKPGEDGEGVKAVEVPTDKLKVEKMSIADMKRAMDEVKPSFKDEKTTERLRSFK